MNANPEQTLIRPATIDDLGHILRHRCSMFRDMGTATEAELVGVAAVAEEFFRKALPNGEYRGWLAVTQSGVVAAGAGITVVPWPGHPRETLPWRGWIQNVYTEPEFRRRGLARRLVETVIDWCRAQGFHTVSLHASHDGRGMYESLGFRPTNEMRLQLS